MTMDKHICVCIDSSDQAWLALGYACKRLYSKETRMHVLTVLPPLTNFVAPTAPIATSGAVTALTQNVEARRKQDHAEAMRQLNQAKEHCAMFDVPPGRVTYHILTAEGGASGVAESVVRFVTAVERPFLVLGSRGLGSFSRAMLGIVGLGSVSDYCLRRAPCPVAVVKNASKDANLQPGGEAVYKVALCVDDSEHSRRGVRWAIHNLGRRDAQLHVVSVAQPVALPFIDETTAAMASLQSRDWEREREAALANAESECAKAIEVVRQSKDMHDDQIFWKALRPEGGASEVAKSLVHYCKDNAITVCVVGSHGYGAVTRSLRSFIGLGSVSDYCVHHMECVVCVVKPDTLGLEEDGDGSGALHSDWAAVTAAKEAPQKRSQSMAPGQAAVHASPKEAGIEV